MIPWSDLHRIWRALVQVLSRRSGSEFWRPGKAWKVGTGVLLKPEKAGGKGVLSRPLWKSLQYRRLLLHSTCTTLFNQDRGTRVPLVTSLCVPFAEYASSGLRRLLEVSKSLPGMRIKTGLGSGLLVLDLDLDLDWRLDWIRR